MSESNGVVYLCTGSYQDMLRNSLLSLNRTNQGLDFHILSDRPLSIPFTWIPNWIGKESRRVKTRLFDYTPFDLTLFVDTDTVFGESIDIAALLGDADLAMAHDANPNLSRGTKTFLNYPGFTTAEEVEETLGMCGGDFPFFNSGVMVWRQTERVREFFDRWHSEWLKYKRVDQFALARALVDTNIRVKTLEKKFNFPVLSTDFTRDKAIYHLIFKENIAKQAGLWEPEFPDLMNPGMGDIIEKRFRAENHYLHIGREIFEDAASSSLIICPDNDEQFWKYCSHDRCKFVVEGSNPIDRLRDGTYAIEFGSRVGEWVSRIDVPNQINHLVDYIIINGPKGFDTNCPGREIPIAWASTLARKRVYVFDYNRDWEREVCNRYLGEPDYVIPPRGKGNAHLAVFQRG